MSYLIKTLLILLSLFCCSKFSSSQGNLTTNQILKDPETLDSTKSIFKLGFFSPINSTNRYLGIWYNKHAGNSIEVVWVANRNNPLDHNSSGVLTLIQDGNLHLMDGRNKSIWSTNITSKNDLNQPVLQLLDTGNLVLLSNNSGFSGDIIWQSFDHFTDTLLLHMKLDFGANSSSKTSNLVSWMSASNPSKGRFSAGIYRRNLSEFYIWDGDRPYWRSGPWNGNLFLGVKALYYSAHDAGFHLESDNQGGISLSFSSASQRVFEHYVVTYDGMMALRDWDDEGGNWFTEWQSIEYDCDVFGKCGEFGFCDSKTRPICSCLRGFEPRNRHEWGAGDWSKGCLRRTPVQCGSTGGKSDGFYVLKNVKVPDNAVWLDSNDREDCRTKCLPDCSCLAYAYYTGFGCMIWSGSLIDIQEFSDIGVDLYIRVAYSELGESNKWKAIIAVITILGTMALVLILYFLWRWKNKPYAKTTTKFGLKNNKSHEYMVGSGAGQGELQDLPLFKFEDLMVGTNEFCEINKLGQGGFGSVYKGKLEDGQEIAVKRLSRASVQGLQEFMNEVDVISKLQHRNLVRLLGCCVEGEEKLLVYEYLPNKSLDAFLFNPIERKLLDWNKRFNIILGISRGLLYLHRDSRLRIIHRDLKAGNILLDDNLNPKISDFGMAKIFGGNQDHDNTRRIVGTYGYMSPEYAMEGVFSEKSDVFSFGVLLLEIISGRRNSSFKDEQTLSLLGHTWKLWNEGNIVSLVDPTIESSNNREEILRCIQVGLLCVEDVPEDRPSMSMVVPMIESEIAHLPIPKQPGFTHRRICNGDLHSPQFYSVNHVSITSMTGR
ncbi:unnamed protein product [Amaranthus hypochondriacus]